MNDSTSREDWDLPAEPEAASPAEEVREAAAVYDPIEGLYERHAELVDFSFTQKLSKAEEVELADSRAALDRSEEPHFRSVKQQLLAIRDQIAVAQR